MFAAFRFKYSGWTRVVNKFAEEYSTVIHHRGFEMICEGDKDECQAIANEMNKEIKEIRIIASSKGCTIDYDERTW